MYINALRGDFTEENLFLQQKVCGLGISAKDFLANNMFTKVYLCSSMHSN